MFEPRVRDGAARVASWELGGRTLATPFVLYVDTERIPAPSFAQVRLSQGEPEGDAPWVRDAGSIFENPTREEPERVPELTIPRDLPYHPAGGMQLVESADEVNRERGGRVFVATAPTGPVPEEAEVVVVANAASLVDDPFKFAEHIVALRERAGPGRLLYVPGAATPANLALLVYAGVDLVDSAAVALDARRGRFVSSSGSVPVEELEGERPCACPACNRGDDGFPWLRDHAFHALESEVRLVRSAVRGGRLRELVEQRVRVRPELVAHLRRFDHDHAAFFEERVPVLRERELRVTSDEALHRPEVKRFRDRLASRYRAPESARVLVLLPCSHRKPYSTSRTHRRLQQGLDVANAGAVHEVMLTSPLGVVPRELERTYPAAHYDLPVTGRWSDAEARVVREALGALTSRHRYDGVVVHLVEEEAELVLPHLEDPVRTVQGDDPLSPASLNLLRSTLKKLTTGDAVDPDQRVVEDLRALGRYQFGDAADALLEDVSVRGRAPWLKVDDAGGTQVAMQVPDRGLLSLTLEGGMRLAEAGSAYRVEIEDFHPKGSVFAVGVVDAHPGIRVEDDVVVTHDGEVRAVGRATMPGPEMIEMEQGEAVRGRHHA